MYMKAQKAWKVRTAERRKVKSNLANRIIAATNLFCKIKIRLYNKQQTWKIF